MNKKIVWGASFPLWGHFFYVCRMCIHFLHVGDIFFLCGGSFFHMAGGGGGGVVVIFGGAPCCHIFLPHRYL